MSVLEIRSLTKRFGGLVALDAVSFEIQEGELFGLVGPNGSGKTVLFNTITGIYRSNGGDVVFEGESIRRLSPHAITAKGIARTFQGSRVFPELTVLQNVMVGRHCRTESHLAAAVLKTRAERREAQETRQKALEALELVGLGLVDIKDVPVKGLNFIKHSLVGIAIALATEPKLLLLDEPIAGMNPAEILQAMDLIRKLRDRGITIALVEHNMRAIMGICDRVMVLSYGSKLAEGTPEEISRNEQVIEAYLGRGYAKNRSH